VGWVVVAAAWALAVRDVEIAVRGVVAVWGTLAVNTVIKRSVRRTRPSELEPFIKAPRSYSFPSSHAAMSAAALMSLAGPAGPAGTVALTAAAVTMAGSRVWLGVHYPVDILAGFSLGLVLGTAVLLAA
jgi:undecaprenyl-diphosphatase